MDVVETCMGEIVIVVTTTVVCKCKSYLAALAVLRTNQLEQPEKNKGKEAECRIAFVVRFYCLFLIHFNIILNRHLTNSFEDFIFSYSG